MFRKQKRRSRSFFSWRRRTLANSWRSAVGYKNRQLRIDALEVRYMLAGNIITIGDSWAWLVAANAPGSAPAAPGFVNSMQNMLDTFHPGKTVYNESFAGGTAAHHAGDLAGITSRINAHPDADIVLLSSGGNDMLLGAAGGGFYLGNPSNGAVYSNIANNVNTVVQHILNIRPDIQVMIQGYDYVNMWDGSLAGAAGDTYRANYGMIRADTGNAALNQILNVQQNAQLNQGFRTAAQSQIAIADASRRVHHINNFGLLTALAGYNGVLGTVPATGVYPPDIAPDAPVSTALLNDPIHLNSTGYTALAVRSENEFFDTAFDPASLNLSLTTLDFGPTRVGTSSGNQAVTGSNAGPNFTKVKDLTFGAAAGEFVGSTLNVDPLFRDPLLGSDTASNSYSYSPANRGNDTQPISVTSDSGHIVLTLQGQGVGPVFAANTNLLDFGSTQSDTLTLDIQNATTDGDLGSLTDLTMLTANISGPDAAAFSIDTFVPLTVIEAGGIEALPVEFDGTGLSIGPKTATLTFTTDVGSSFGTPGAQFQITLAASVDSVANLGGPYTGAEGSQIALSGSASIGATQYDWDLDNNGSYETPGENVNFNADDNGVFTVGLRINGVGGPTGSTTVTVANVAPNVSIVGPSSGVPFQPRTFTLTTTDPSPIDQAVGFTFDIDWDGDLVVDETIVGPSGTQTVHTFQAVSTNTVRVTATDKDSGVSTVFTHPINIVRVQLQGTDLVWGGTVGSDAVEFEETASETVQVRTTLLDGVVVADTQTFVSVSGQVIAYGGDAADTIDAGGVDGLTTIGATLIGGRGDDTIDGGDAADTIRGDAEGDGSEGRDVIDGGGGNDLIYGDGVEGAADTIRGGAGNDTIYGDNGDISGDGAEGNDVIYGDDGDDWLFGGRRNDMIFGGNGHDVIDGQSGHDILSGGTGNDSLSGGDGKDLLFAGAGADTLHGNGGDDLMVTGTTTFDFIEADLNLIRKEWWSAGDYATRVSNIGGAPGGANGLIFLQPGITVFDDGDVDTLFGESQNDWFLYSKTGLIPDIAGDVEGGEVETDIA